MLTDSPWVPWDNRLRRAREEQGEQDAKMHSRSSVSGPEEGVRDGQIILVYSEGRAHRV